MLVKHYKDTLAIALAQSISIQLDSLYSIRIKCSFLLVLM